MNSESRHIRGGLVADREFLACVRREPEATIAVLCDRLRVTPTAIRQRANRLAGQGLVDRIEQRNGRGRPAHVYQLTTAGRRWLGDASADLAMTLWQVIRDEPDATVQQRLMLRLQSELVRRYRRYVAGGDPGQRMKQLATALNADGFEVSVEYLGGDESPNTSRGDKSNLLDGNTESDEDLRDRSNPDHTGDRSVQEISLPVLREHWCPYYELASSDRQVCELERQVFEEVLGSQVTRTSCCLDGDACCEFEASRE